LNLLNTRKKKGSGILFLIAGVTLSFWLIPLYMKSEMKLSMMIGNYMLVVFPQFFVGAFFLMAAKKKRDAL
jgi:hypothetical protein